LLWGWETAYPDRAPAGFARTAGTGQLYCHRLDSADAVFLSLWPPAGRYPKGNLLQRDLVARPQSSFPDRGEDKIRRFDRLGVLLREFAALLSASIYQHGAARDGLADGDGNHRLASPRHQKPGGILHPTAQ